MNWSHSNPKNYAVLKVVREYSFHVVNWSHSNPKNYAVLKVVREYNFHIVNWSHSNPKNYAVLKVVREYTVWQKKKLDSFNFRISLRWIIRRTWKDIRFKANWYDNNIHAYQVESSSTFAEQILCFQTIEKLTKNCKFLLPFLSSSFIALMSVTSVTWVAKRVK